jgi:hypothetical protein
MQERYPELYAYLRRRDAELQRILRRIPSPADVALSASFDLRTQIGALRDALGGGLDTLAHRQSPDRSRPPLLTSTSFESRPGASERAHDPF